MVVLKHLIPAALLGVAMLVDRPPPHHGFLVTPGRARQDPARPARALEAFVVDEAVYLFKDRSQSLRKFELEVELLLLGMDFKDH
jgi:hypothetical protein